jgi:hypothetical protein
MLTRRSLLRSLPGITAASWVTLKSGGAAALPFINFPASAEQAGAARVSGSRSPPGPFALTLIVQPIRTETRAYREWTSKILLPT